MSSKLLIIAGEASGDLHGSSLIKEIRNIDDSVEFIGIGGDKMIDAGLKAKYHINEMAFLGFLEVVKHLPFIKKVKKEMLKLVQENNIRKVVLIDYPGFNLSLAKSFKKLGVEVIYYISPQIWAWGKGRIKKIKKLVKRMLVFFPFEKKLYTSNGIHSDFVGHPLAKSIDEYNFLTRNELIEKHNLVNKEILVLLPGSRKQELEKILPDVLKASDKICSKYNLQTIIACADNIEEDYFNRLKDEHEFTLVKGETYNLLKNSKFGIIKSGTSTLEAGIIGTPFLVVYKTNYLTYLIGKALIKINNISLANIVAEKTVVKELIQDDVNPDKIYDESKKILSNTDNYQNLKIELSKIKAKLKTDGNPSRKAAEIICAELNAI